MKDHLISLSDKKPRFRRSVFRIVGAVLGMSFAWIAASTALAEELPPLEGRENLALGRPVVFSPAPDYGLTGQGESDATDLTDGKLSGREDRKIWFDSSAVGWSYAGRVNLAVDLGRPARVDEIAIRLLGGSPQAGISIPGWIEAFVSYDGEHYFKVAECSRWREGDFKRFAVPFDAGKAWIHCLRFSDLDVRGPWIALRMYTGGLSAADELYVWSVDRLYPEWMHSSQVSTYTCLYPYHLELIGNEVRQDRRRLPKSDVLPWLTPGDAGTYPGECLQWALLECYTNGARGVYFWSGRVRDPRFADRPDCRRADPQWPVNGPDRAGRRPGAAAARVSAPLSRPPTGQTDRPRNK